MNRIHPAARAIIRRLLLASFLLCWAAAGFTPAPRTVFAALFDTPRITSVSIREVAVAGDKVTFIAELSGTGFGSNPNALTSVELLNPDGAAAGTVTGKKVASDSKIEVTAQAPLGTVISTVRLTLGVEKIETSNFKLTLKALAPLRRSSLSRSNTSLGRAPALRSSHS